MPVASLEASARGFRHRNETACRAINRSLQHCLTDFSAEQLNANVIRLPGYLEDERKDDRALLNELSGGHKPATFRPSPWCRLTSFQCKTGQRAGFGMQRLALARGCGAFREVRGIPACLLCGLRKRDLLVERANCDDRSVLHLADATDTLCPADNGSSGASVTPSSHDSS